MDDEAVGLADVLEETNSKCAGTHTCHPSVAGSDTGLVQANLFCSIGGTGFDSTGEECDIRGGCHASLVRVLPSSWPISFLCRGDCHHNKR